MTRLTWLDLEHDLVFQDSRLAGSNVVERTSRFNGRLLLYRYSVLLLISLAVLSAEESHVDAFMNQNRIHNNYNSYSSPQSFSIMNSVEHNNNMKFFCGAVGFRRFNKRSCRLHDNNTKYNCRETQRRNFNVLASHYGSDNGVEVWNEKDDDKIMKKKYILRALGLAYCLRSFVGLNKCLVWGSSALTLAMVYHSRNLIREKMISNMTNQNDANSASETMLLEKDEVLDELPTLRKGSNAWVSASLRRVDELDALKGQQRVAEIVAKEMKRLELNKQWAQDALRASDEAMKFAQEQRRREREQNVIDESLVDNILNKEHVTY